MFLASLLCLAVAQATELPLRYRLQLRGAGDSKVYVTIEPGGAPLPQTLIVPRAIPMGYGEQPYDRFVSGVCAETDDGAADVVRADGSRWRIGGAGSLRAIRYTVDLRDMERTILAASDTSKARRGYVGLLGYSVFAYLEGGEQRPVTLEVAAPAGWPVFSTLAPKSPPEGGVTATAANFYALADSQIAMGPRLQVRRVDARVPLYLAVYAECDVDLDVLGAAGQRALDALVEYFGSAPFEHYTIHQEYLKPLSHAHGYGFSMEHLDSGTFFMSTDPEPTRFTPRQLSRLEYNYAHHIAHSWIPKRCYSKGYFPFSWELAPVLDSIWFSEGFGQYVAMVALAEKTGGTGRLRRMIDLRFRAWLPLAPKVIRQLSTVELSRVASTRYSTDFRTGRASFARGGLMAAAIDERIRERTNGEKSLRDALRYLVQWSERNRRAFELEQLPSLLEAGCGVDVKAVVEEWLRPREG